MYLILYKKHRQVRYLLNKNKFLVFWEKYNYYVLWLFCVCFNRTRVRYDRVRTQDGAKTWLPGRGGGAHGLRGFAAKRVPPLCRVGFSTIE